MRNFQTPGRDTVENFYLLNHRLQTLDFVKNQFKRFVSTPTSTRSMTWLEALTYLDTLVDDSDRSIKGRSLQFLAMSSTLSNRVSLTTLTWFISWFSKSFLEFSF